MKVWLPAAASRQFLEFLTHRRQPKLAEVGFEQLDHDIGHRQAPLLEGVRIETRRTQRLGPTGPDQAKNTRTGISAD